MTTAMGYAALDARSPLGPFRFERRDLRPHDVRIQIAYCGVCHSDLHMARNEWGQTEYPLVPGHEIVGQVTDIGKAVERYRAGDVVAVGCMVDSDRTCPSCKE